MKSAPFISRFLALRVHLSSTVAALALGAGVVGCGTQILSYNQEFRQQGLAQYEKSDYVKASSSFQEALRQEPGDYTSRFYLGQCYDKLNHPQAAIQQYRTCLDVMSHSLEGKGDTAVRNKVLTALASAIASEPDKSGDLTALERQQPRTAENALQLARIYRQSGDADTALTRFDEAQQIDASDPEIAKEYGLYLEQLGQTKRADAQLRRAYALNSKDEEVAAALRRLGVVPGPSLKDADALAKPFMPLGPIPEVDLSTSNKTSTPQQAPSNSPGAVGTTNSPRD